METTTTQPKPFFLKLLGYICLKIMTLKPMHKFHQYMGINNSIDELKKIATIKNLFGKK